MPKNRLISGILSEGFVLVAKEFTGLTHLNQRVGVIATVSMNRLVPATLYAFRLPLQFPIDQMFSGSAVDQLIERGVHCKLFLESELQGGAAEYGVITTTEGTG